MGKYILRKLFQALIVLLLITFLSYLIMEMIPGDAVSYAGIGGNAGIH